VFNNKKAKLINFIFPFESRNPANFCRSRLTALPSGQVSREPVTYRWQLLLLPGKNMLRWLLLQCWQHYFQTVFTKLSDNSKRRALLLFWYWRQSVLISDKSPPRGTDQRFCHAAY